MILAGDHIYKMNYRKMVELHREAGSRSDRWALRVTAEEAREFGVMEVDPRTTAVVGFDEKPPDPKTFPATRAHCAGFDGHLRVHGPVSVRAALPRRHPPRQRARLRPQHDSVDHRHARVFAFPFRDENRKHDAYWRDVGTLDAYYEANMDLACRRSRS